MTVGGSRLDYVQGPTIPIVTVEGTRLGVVPVLTNPNVTVEAATSGYDQFLTDPTVTVEGPGVRCELAGVRYEYNVLGTRGPRKMTALIPGTDAHGQSFIFRPEAGNDSILDRSAL